jgi:translin
MKELIPEIESIADEASVDLSSKNAAREAALARCRDAIRHSANAIRAVHRSEFDLAEDLVARAGKLLAEAREALRDHPDIFYAGFVHDSQKEYAEAKLTLGIIAGGKHKLPRPHEIGVELQAYLNGLGETVGELRRHLLDRLRAGDIDHCEETLGVMDVIYGILVTFDYPDAMTGGLRRTTDNVRGILERTRGDLTVAATQRDLARTLSEFEARLQGESSPRSS